MPTITFRDPESVETRVEAEVGESLMEAAIRSNVPGIDAECGGACSCATCHVIVDPTYWNKVGAAGGNEASMLDFAEELETTSRLACQIQITEALDGLIVRTPESQG